MSEFNVHDFLKSLSIKDIRDYCKLNTMPHAIAMNHVSGDFNLGTLIRNANFFGFEQVYYIGGKKSFDRRSTVGTHHYTPVGFCPTIDSFFEAIQNVYTPIAVENNVDTNFRSHSYTNFKYPKKTVLLFGEEQMGLSNDILTRCDGIVTVIANGSVRSLNVGTTSGILAAWLRYEYDKISYEPTTHKNLDINISI
jgi:tRNA G18 (ribose-2'-O)-methylase SpoU